VVLLGNNGLINGPLVRHHVITSALPLMYNHLGIFIGTTEFTLPFAVFSLIGVLRTISPSLVQAGAGRTARWPGTPPGGPGGPAPDRWGKAAVALSGASVVLSVLILIRQRRGQ